MIKSRWLIVFVALVSSCSKTRPPSPVPLLSPVPSATAAPSSTFTRAFSTASPTPLSTLSSVAISSPTPPKASPTENPPADPFDLVSQASLFAFMEDLTAIQPYSGWRNSASQGEREALDYVAGKLSGMAYLRDWGLELERQSFRVFLGTELWETRLYLRVNGQTVEVPADSLRGPRDDIAQALRFDSDGTLNDAERNPVVVEGPVVLVRSAAEASALRGADVEDKIVLLDYAAIDRSLMETQQAVQIAWRLMSREPAGLVVVTQFSNQIGASHGAFIGDNSVFNHVEGEAAPPTLYVRLEDLAPAGIVTWDDLAQIEAAHLIWDADVFAPADSGNLVAHIPGADVSQAVILGAHIDSPNSPGALDDGSGSVTLLEVARVLNEARAQPPVDLYLVWFGSEELGLYGAANFVATHQELLDRTLAMLQIDMLSRPLDGIDAHLTLATWSYGQLGDERLLWPDALTRLVAHQGIETVPESYYFIYSDNSVFGGFGVPNADLIYTNEAVMGEVGGVHYASHVHTPYDTTDLAREEGDVLEQMARVALTAALQTPQQALTLRVPPAPDRRALFIASHTETAHMTPASFTEFGMALALEGFDVDLIPYGQAVTPVDLEATDLVVALPILDYPSPDGDPELYDEAWTEAEIAALEAYVADGGLLILTNSVHRLKYGNRLYDLNEDWDDVNALAGRFGIVYQPGTLFSVQAQAESDHPLMEDVMALELAEFNGVPFSLTEGQVLARAGGDPVVALVDHGGSGGQTLVLSDVGILGSPWGPPANLTFWQNLARYARLRR